ncbi:MAG: dCTP deaminase [Dongiaceae bacterium]
MNPANSVFDHEAVLVELTEQVMITADGFELLPRRLALAWTREFIDLKFDTRLAGRVEGKSSLARLGLGVHVTAPTIHAGFKGRIRLELLNHGSRPIRLRLGMRICQLIFEQTFGTPDHGYQERFLGQTTTRRG